MAFVRRMVVAGTPIVDPLAGQLTAIGLADALLDMREIFADARLRSGAFRDAVVDALGAILAGDTAGVIGAVETV